MDNLLDLNIDKLDQPAIEFYIGYIQDLLEARQRDYEAFGATNEDLSIDRQLKANIQELKNKLN